MTAFLLAKFGLSPIGDYSFRDQLRHNRVVVFQIDISGKNAII
jgi:hypothetical protein